MTRSGESVLLLLDVIDLLTDQNIEYAVVGALAASIHGAVRASMDADVVLSVGVPEAGSPSASEEVQRSLWSGS